MKRTFVILSLLIAGSLNAQNTPVVEKSAPESNNALPSGGSLGSQSGVNPMGNPGTIANSAASSSGANSAIAPHPNSEPGVFLTSSPEGTVTGTTTTINNQKVEAARVVTSTGTVTAVVKEPTPAAPTPAVKPITTTRARRSVDVSSPTPKKVVPVAAAPAPVKAVTKPLPAYKPVLGNYVSEATIDKINAKYGAAVYDIRAVRLANSNKIAYIVRLRDNDTLRNELFYED